MITEWVKTWYWRYTINGNKDVNFGDVKIQDTHKYMYEGQSNYMKTFAMAILLNIILLLNLVDIF